MNKLAIKTVLLVAGLATCGYAAAGGRGTSAVVPAPTIVKTAMNEHGNALIISGHNFGAKQPTVMLADQVLEVRHHSEHEVVAGLPQGLAAANYGVTLITNDSTRARSNLFSTTVSDGAGR